jgi:hypothetical protein
LIVLRNSLHTHGLFVVRLRLQESQAMTAARSTTSNLQSLLDAQIVRGATLCFAQAARMTDRPAELERVRRLRAWLRMEKLRSANELALRVLLERDLKGGIPLTL